MPHYYRHHYSHSHDYHHTQSKHFMQKLKTVNLSENSQVTEPKSKK